MISVLLPTYNSAATLVQSIECILNQSVAAFELLVLDDGSTDSTREVMNSINDRRVKYCRLPHQGLTVTLNYGLSVASHDIIARMDADDLCVPWRFERQLEYLSRQPENVLLSCWYAVFEERTIRSVVKTPVQSHQIKKGLLLHSYISHPGLMCHKQTLVANGGYVNNVGVDAFQDYETWLAIKDSVTFVNIPEVLVFQRYRSDSLSNNIAYKQRIMYEIQIPYYEHMEREFSIVVPSEAMLYRGWREYFYGDPETARMYWQQAGWSFIVNPRVLIAWCISFLPEPYFIRFKESRWRHRLHYLIEYFTPSSMRLRKTFTALLRHETS